jgi:hypothetical protein
MPLHIVTGNYGTHKHQAVGDWLEKNRGSPAFDAHVGVVLQGASASGRDGLAAVQLPRQTADRYGAGSWPQ